MALWKDSNSPAPAATPGPEPVPLKTTAPAGGNIAPSAGPAPVNPAATQPKARMEMKESVISAGLAIEGKIVGSGHVRVAGKFKGDVQVDGNLHIDSGAVLEGQVRASEVMVSGELQGNIESAKRVDLQQGGVITGDVKAGSLTVAAGSRMRGNVEFGWEDSGKSIPVDIKGRISGL
jgi:cytoskeletal protein CcmA (bactofilin family)